jgi:long-chain acyl-CoA synthetase
LEAVRAPGRQAFPDLGGAARSAAEWLGLKPGDRNLCLLPFSSATTRVLDLYAPLAAGATIQLPETAASVPEDLREAAPTVLTVVPRALELLERESTLRPQRALYGWGMRREGRVARTLVRRPVARRLGVHAVRHITCLDGPVCTRTATFFATLGVPIHDAFAFGGRVALAQGEPLPGVDATVRDGELVICGRATGERAEYADGRFRLLGRHGLEPLERALRESPYVRHAVVVPGAGALLEVDAEMVSVWGARRDVAFGSYRSLVEHPSVRELLAREVPESVKAFAVLPRPLTVADGELTATLRVNREPVVERYAPLLGGS